MRCGRTARRLAVAPCWPRGTWAAPTKNGWNDAYRSLHGYGERSASWTFKDDRGATMARCGQDLWVRPAFTLEDLNANRIRRWYADCPRYDDSE